MKMKVWLIVKKPRETAFLFSACPAIGEEKFSSYGLRKLALFRMNIFA